MVKKASPLVLTLLQATAGCVAQSTPDIYNLRSNCTQATFSTTLAIMPSKETLRNQIEQNFTNSDYTIEQLAKDSFTHRSNLYRVFKKLFGLSPCKYLRKKRLQHGEELLKNGARVSDAAYSSGFTDPSYFSRCYRQQFGSSPSKSM